MGARGGWGGKRGTASRHSQHSTARHDTNPFFSLTAPIKSTVALAPPTSTRVPRIEGGLRAGSWAGTGSAQQSSSQVDMQTVK